MNAHRNRLANSDAAAAVGRPVFGGMNSRGIVNVLLVTAIFMTFTTLALGGTSIYFISEYNKAKTTVDQQKADAAAAAREEQKQADEAEFVQRQKEPNRNYSAPLVLGALNISYPRNWNLYAEEKPEAGLQLNLFWNPDLVQSENTYDGTYALRAILEKTVYNLAVAKRQSAVEKGELTAEPITVSGINGTRYRGRVAENHTGILVILPIRDKTLSIWTESIDYTNDFNTIIERLAVSP